MAPSSPFATGSRSPHPNNLTVTLASIIPQDAAAAYSRFVIQEFEEEAAAAAAAAAASKAAARRASAAIVSVEEQPQAVLVSKREVDTDDGEGSVGGQVRLRTTVSREDRYEARKKEISLRACGSSDSRWRPLSRLVETFNPVHMSPPVEAASRLNFCTCPRCSVPANQPVGQIAAVEVSEQPERHEKLRSEKSEKTFYLPDTKAKSKKQEEGYDDSVVGRLVLHPASNHLFSDKVALVLCTGNLDAHMNKLSAFYFSQASTRFPRFGRDNLQRHNC